jgi:hypothetical protein
MVAFEFATGGRVVGRATWLGPGMVELDFSEQQLRQHFAKWLGEPRSHNGPVFETGHMISVWPDENRAHFAEACLALSNLYTVRRVL